MILNLEQPGDLEEDALSRTIGERDMHKTWWAPAVGRNGLPRMGLAARGLLPGSGATSGEVVAQGSQSLCTQS